MSLFLIRLIQTAGKNFIGLARYNETVATANTAMLCRISGKRREMTPIDAKRPSIKKNISLRTVFACVNGIARSVDGGDIGHALQTL
jgi:hypothetical protein